VIKSIILTTSGGLVHRAVTVVFAFIVALGALRAPDFALAGTLCGTVRDVSTNAPISRAGLFLRTPAGTYTGFYAASDNQGHYCMGGIPPGYYDLEVRVDDYMTGWVRNIEVVEDVSGVDVDLPSAQVPLLPPFPNPASDRVRFVLRLAEESPVSVIVIDAQGRLVQGWQNASLPSGEHQFTWDFTDRSGQPVKSGLYFVRLLADNLEMIRSFVHLPR
jgi:hypothetical protein